MNKGTIFLNDAVLREVLNAHRPENVHLAKRHFYALILIANGCCTSREISRAALMLKIAPSHTVDINVCLIDLKAAGLVMKRDDILTPYRGTSHAVVYCTLQGYNFIAMIDNACDKILQRKMKRLLGDASL